MQDIVVINGIQSCFLQGVDPNQYQDILVMDQDRIKLFDIHGNVKDELIDNQITKFRGLTCVNLDGKMTIITTEKSRQGVQRKLCSGSFERVPRYLSIFEQWVPEPIDFGKKGLQFILLSSKHRQERLVTRH